MKKFKFSTVTSLEWKNFFLEFFDKEVLWLHMQIALIVKVVLTSYMHFISYYRLMKVCLMQ